LGNSLIFDNGTGIGVGTTAPGATLDVNGTVNAATGYDLGGGLFAFGSITNRNAFLGYSGNATMTGIHDVSLGFLSLDANTTGTENTAVGYVALNENTTGSANTAVGSGALAENNIGYDNTAGGWGALVHNTVGNYNTANGFEALWYNTTGSNNTANGLGALLANITGNYNTALGYGAGPDSKSTNLTYATALGAGAVVSQSNTLVLGGPLGSGANVKVGIGTAAPANVFTIAQGAGPAISDGWNVYSSRRWKTNIETLHGALGKVEQLRGVSYELKANGKHEMGVIAEEVGAVVPEVVTWDQNGKDAQSVDYGRLTALLIEATKEQQALIEQQQEQIAQLTLQVKTIQASLKTSGQAGSEVRTVKADLRTVRQ
jgi:hypothetical protein